MAERRMFAKTIVLSDAFLDMPLGSRCLYMTLSMLADDDGFVNSPKSIMRQSGTTEDDLRVLIAKKFILPFESGVIVIKHWRINNYLRSDRHQDTKYVEEKGLLELDCNGAYTLKDADGIRQDQTEVYRGIPMETTGIPSVGIPRLGKDRLGKDRLGKDIYVSPEPSGSAPPVITLTLNDGTEFPITVDKVEEWKKLYPAVDVVQELRAMRGWCDANPTKRKTRNGILRFVNGWLAKEQDRGGRKEVKPARGHYTGERKDDLDAAVLSKVLGKL